MGITKGKEDISPRFFSMDTCLFHVMANNTYPNPNTERTWSCNGGRVFIYSYQAYIFLKSIMLLWIARQFWSGFPLNIWYIPCCEGNPLVTDGFPSQVVSNAELWCFFDVNLSKLWNKRVEFSVIWDYNDVLMSAMASQITSVSIICSTTVCSGVDQRKHKASRHWPLWGESTGVRWIPLTKGQ